MSITVQNIIDSYGAYYEQGSQNLQRLKAVPMQEPQMLKQQGINSIMTRDTVYRMANPIFASVLQPYQKAFTTKGNVEFLANEIRLRQMKVDMSFYPADIEDSWLGFLAGDSSRNQENWPIARYILEHYLLPKAQEDKELEAIYKGVYKEPQNETAGSPVDSMDGFKKLLIDGSKKEKCKVNVIENLGTFDADVAQDYIEAFDSKIDSKFRNKKMLIFVAPEMLLSYLRDRRDNKNYFISSDAQISTNIDFTNHQLVACEAMAGTTDIFATLPENIVHLKKRDISAVNIDVQKADRQVKFLVDWWEAVGFNCNALVWTSKETVTE